jgi:WD40 repeat protein
LFWDSDGVLKKSIAVEVEQPESQDDALNELRVVRLCGSRYLITGDKLGVMRVLDLVDGQCQTSLRAHAGEITDIAVYETNETLVASAGRDRTVQVFELKDRTCELLQTLDEHVGAVTGLVFTPNGKHLLSCSSDRTVVVREALTREENGQFVTAFIILRTVTLKATPVSMTIPYDRDDILWISAVDRNVHKYNLRNGHLSDSFKVTDNEGSDAVVLSSLACVPTYNSQNTSMIAGVSTTDKSIRVYDENGTLLGRDWGHTEGVTDLTLIKTKDDKDDSPGPASLVTVAADGTVFIWAFGSRTTHKRDLSQSMELMGLNTPSKDLLVNKPPLRRVLSQTEMARFQEKSTDDDSAVTPTIRKTPQNPTLAKRSSRFSLAQTPRLEPSPMSTFDPSGRRRATKANSPSPPTSPKSQRAVTRKISNPTISSSARTRTRGTGFGTDNNGLATYTDNICRNLRSYRKRLATSSDDLSAETLKSLERELGLTARAVGEKAMKARGVAEETVMVKLLSQYSERLLEMLDEKFAATLAKQISGNGTLTPPDSGGGGGAEDAMTLEDERHPSIQEEEV